MADLRWTHDGVVFHVIVAIQVLEQMVFVGVVLLMLAPRAVANRNNTSCLCQCKQTITIKHAIIKHVLKLKHNNKPQSFIKTLLRLRSALKLS